jgi:methylated-DNA-protein-cysteine methyltransferase-like protein
MKNNFREKVFEAVKKIPRGKVSTYGQVALILGKPRGAREVGWPCASAQGKMLLARAVGNALHSNTDLRVPCHRVVDRTGRLAPNFAFDGMAEQRRRLENEDVAFVDEAHVDLDKHLWKSR